MLAQEVAVVALDEAHLHALALVGLQRVALVAQVVAHLQLGVFAQGEKAAAQHVLPQPPQEVRLVLLVVVTRHDVAFAILFFDACIMACGDVGTTQAVGPLRQDAELEQRVAHHTGVGRASRTVFVDEILYDGTAEVFAFVGHVVLDAHTLGQTACLHRLVAPHPHGEAHNLVALLAQHQARGGAVYAAAHAHQNSLFRSVHKLLVLLWKAKVLFFAHSSARPAYKMAKAMQAQASASARAWWWRVRS